MMKLTKAKQLIVLFFGPRHRQVLEVSDMIWLHVNKPDLTLMFLVINIK